jgi:hypothetical protein
LADDNWRTAQSAVVPNFLGKQALDAWLSGHDVGLFVQGPDPDSPHPLINGRVVAQLPAAGSRLSRWDAVIVWLSDDGDYSGVREPRRPLPNRSEGTGARQPND